MKAPTMVYAPDDDKFNIPGTSTKGDGYFYKVVDADEVPACLKAGWYAAPTDLPKKRKRGPNKVKEVEDVKAETE